MALNIDRLAHLGDSKVGAIQSTLKETSLDDKNGEYMVAASVPVFDMDAAMRSYVESLPKQDGCPRSVDALLLGEDGAYYLLEFKNGSVNKDEVLNKLYASLLMLQDVCGLSVETTRSKFVFVLVYNRAKTAGQGCNASSPSRRVNDAHHFGRIRQGVTKHTKAYDRHIPKTIRGIGNSIKSIFVSDYIPCDKDDFEEVLHEALERS